MDKQNKIAELERQLAELKATADKKRTDWNEVIASLADVEAINGITLARAYGWKKSGLTNVDMKKIMATSGWHQLEIGVKLIYLNPKFWTRMPHTVTLQDLGIKPAPPRPFMRRRKSEMRDKALAYLSQVPDGFEEHPSTILKTLGFKPANRSRKRIERIARELGLKVWEFGEGSRKRIFIKKGEAKPDYVPNRYVRLEKWDVAEKICKDIFGSGRTFVQASELVKNILQTIGIGKHVLKPVDLMALYKMMDEVAAANKFRKE